MHLALGTILQGQCEPVSIAGFLTALAAKGETAEEVAGMAQAMRDHAVVVTPKSKDTIDIVGTGGDGRSTFNISTTTALVVAGCGVKVAKHGNRAITSKCGSADILAQLGVKIDAAPETIARCIDEANIGFMFAPAHHPAMKYVQPIRKELGFRTVFNVLGPLSNPARVPAQFTGVAKPELISVMAEALKRLGLKRAMVVHCDGMDELTTGAPAKIAQLVDGKITEEEVNARDFGLASASEADIRGGSLEDNERITRSIVNGGDTSPRLDVVLFNAAGGLMVAGMAKDFTEGVAIARQSITSGNAQESLERFVEISNS
jgi:anthranilate phosphoribosyltransferase